jgi:isoleucyl-tRNA synthetase
MSKKADYSKTLNLPKTDFPMKADLARREPEMLARWDQMRLYDQLQQARKTSPPYILHDGPPYANGHIHIGTALNKILKDFVVKSKAMGGKRTPFIPGWDCHGLPIEHQVVKELGPRRHQMSRLEIRQHCREYAQKFIKIQRDEFKRLGGLGDWENPYLTMTPDYEADIVREFGKVVKAGGVYRAKKPVLWCPNDETALAEAEVEYEEHTSPSIYVKLNIAMVVGDEKPADYGLGHFILIWTTTPWTLPANQAVALHPTEKYLRVEVGWKGRKEIWILAEKLLKTCMGKFGLTDKDYQVTGSPFTGDSLKARYEHPFADHSLRPILTANFVSMDEGTGCVHIAPGHGREDYELFLLHEDEGQIKMVAPVDHQGRFTDEVGIPGLSGKNVFKANDAIIQLLDEKGALIKHESITHTYPHCWRCKKPVIFRATEQWFISMEKNRLRERALAEIDRIAAENGWIPPWGRDRIHGMIESRPDWCISRQRAWGVPIVAFTCLQCKNILYLSDPEKYAALIRHVADRIEGENGSDVWFSKSADQLLPKGTTCPQCKGTRFEKENDILDVWFESGVSHAAVLKTRPELSWPADLYLEGSDQHRGWFHSTLLAALETDGQAPYQAVLTHGFVVDGEGKKMSKSAGNVIAPQEVIQQHGAELLRLWVAATDFREDIRISREILSHLVEAYRKIRNTCRFLLGNLYDFDLRRDGVSDDRLEEMDRFLLHRLQRLNDRIRKAYDDFEFHIVFHALNNFCAVDLSALYLDVLKDRLYTERADSATRRAAQTTLHQCLIALVRLMAPVLSFTAEEIWKHLPESARPDPFRGTESVHLCTFPEVQSRHMDESLSARWDQLLRIRQEVGRVLERLRAEKRIGSSLDAEVRLYAKEALFEFLSRNETVLAPLLIVSSVKLSPWKAALPSEAAEGEEMKELAVLAKPAEGQKCARCWRYYPSIGRSPDHPMLCDRCVDAVRSVSP